MYIVDAKEEARSLEGQVPRHPFPSRPALMITYLDTDASPLVADDDTEEVQEDVHLVQRLVTSICGSLVVGGCLSLPFFS